MAAQFGNMIETHEQGRIPAQDALTERLSFSVKRHRSVAAAPLLWSCGLSHPLQQSRE
jgi:hypothetical protein